MTAFDFSGIPPAAAFVVFLMSLHFIGDWLLQTSWMAMNKSRSWIALGTHVLVYSLTFLLPLGVTFAVVTGLLHFLVDAITSRITSAFWSKHNYRFFFLTIGVDQLIHLYALVWVAVWLNLVP